MRTMVFGESDAFHALLVDVLRDLRVEPEFVEGSAARPDLVFAMVRQGDVFGVLELARRAAHGAPIVAVMSLTDPKVAQRADLGGAHDICTLDGPLDDLRRALLRALERQARLRSGNVRHSS
ncbi:MAG: DNA-binding response regulator [Myxococcaceae bacterium]|nr:DNA-binding response regulator [Myxococcaceae bacterium]